MGNVLDREEYIEQAYFFRVLRERLGEQVPTQEILRHVHEELLSTTRLPLAVQFLGTELKHTGLLSSGFRKLPHYFTAFQTFVIDQAEDQRTRFSVEIALLVLEREAEYRARGASQAGLFVYQFEALSRNRLGYDAGLLAMAKDPLFDPEWQAFLQMVRQQIGVVDFADLVYLRSEFYRIDQLRRDADYVTPLAILFGEKEGKIARANRGRDPLYFFAALQRQLGYPEVPRQKPRDDMQNQVIVLQAKLRELEQRLKLVEGEVKGNVDMTEFLAKADPSLFPKDEEE